MTEAGAMRYGFFSDLHGDLPALERALEALQDVEMKIFLGDAVGGSRDRECVARLRELQIPWVCGNHDLDPSEVGCLPPDQQAYLAALPAKYQGEGFLGVHSLFLSQRYFYIYTEDEAETLLKHYPDHLVFIGHTHVPALYSNGVVERPERSACFDLRPHQRYVCNVGMTRTSVAVYDSTANRVEFRLFEVPIDRLAAARAKPKPKPKAPAWWEFWKR